MKKVHSQQNNVQITSTTTFMEQSELINQKFLEIMKNNDPLSEATQIFEHNNKFNSEEVLIFSKRFRQLTDGNDIMTYEQFRLGLGLLGREDSFISRIFNIIDQNNDGFINEKDFTSYLGVILNGTDLQKARYGWSILTQNKGDLELKDFMELFQDISVVWNVLTGEIVIPKRRYIEQLFNVFDVDEDQTITFHDYRVFFNEHLLLFGWFEYFNNIQLDEQYSKRQLEKIRQQLKKKLNLESVEKEVSLDEIKINLSDVAINVDKKLHSLNSRLQQVSQNAKRKAEILRNIQQKKKKQKQVRMDSALTGSFSLASKTTQFQQSQNSLSFKSFYKYNHDHISYQKQITKIKHRKQCQTVQNKNSFSIEIIKDLKLCMDETRKIMDMCQQYRRVRNQLRKFSPTKLKQMEAKLNLYTENIQKNHNKQNIPNKTKMMVYFGHQNWNLVLNIMVGLRMSIKALYELNSYIQIKDKHFEQTHEFVLGNKALTSNVSSIFKTMQFFKFIEIAPFVFEKLRNHYGISNDDYQRSVGPQTLLNLLLTGNLTALNEKCSTGKSGSFFYLTIDNKIFLKTIPKSEFVFFTKILKNYYQHMTNFKDTLIVRIFGLYKLKVYVNKQKIDTIYFISMQNIFNKISSTKGLHFEEIYDLKGSLYGRTGTDDKDLKDNDWVERDKKLKMTPLMCQQFKEQIYNDSKFFKKNNINDYSLMVAIIKSDDPLPKQQTQGNIFKSVNGGIASTENNRMYVLSIIDILTAFETFKNFQYIFKSTFLSKDVSCIPPSQYCARFREFMYKSCD